MKKLNIKNILTDCVIVFVIGFVQFYLVMFLLFHPFHFMISGNQYLSLWTDNIDTFVKTIIIITLQVYLSYKVQRYRTVILQIALWFFCFTTLAAGGNSIYTFFRYDKYYQDFDEKKWKEATQKSASMIRVFYEDQRFIGFTKEELIATLGEADHGFQYAYDYFYYKTDIAYTVLIFDFENNKVSSYWLYGDD